MRKGQDDGRVRGHDRMKLALCSKKFSRLKMAKH